MISLETKVDNSTSTLLSSVSSDKEPTLSFSQLLKGVTSKDTKTVQNGSLILSLENDTKEVNTNPQNNTLLSLLKN